MDINYYSLIEMAKNTKTAFSIGIFVPIALAVGAAVWCWISGKLSKKKKTVDADTQAEVQQYPMESVRGLQNLGNTCYFDSTMQALVHTNLVFREKLENLGKKEEFVQIVLEFLSVMQLKTSKPYSPNDLHRLFGKKSPKFADYRQHDSHECLRNFLDNVRKEERDNSGAVDKRKVLTVVDSVFGGHFITVYICKECETPYHVCEALLDISLPIMIDEKDLAAMNSARGSNRKKSRTVKLQTPKTDNTNISKLIKSSMDKSNAGEDSIKPIPSKTEQYSKLDVTFQQNTSDQTIQLKFRTEIAGRHPTSIYAEPLPSDHEFEGSCTSYEPEVRSVQVEAEELHNLNDVVNLSPTNVDLENTSDGKIGDMLKENSLPISRLFDPDTELGTVSLDDNDQKVENSKTTFGTETDFEQVCKAKESDTSEEDNKTAKISDEEKESRNESGSETVAENVENSCSSTEAVRNLAEKYHVANDPSLSQGYSHEPSIPVGTEDNKEREDSEWVKSGARDNPTEIQKCNERQKQSSEKEQQREEEHNYDDENDNKKGEDNKETDDDKDEEKEEEKEVDEEQHNLKHDQELEEQQDGEDQNKQEQNVEQAYQVHTDENDDKKDDAERETDEAENHEKEEEEDHDDDDDDDDDEQENLKQDLELEAQHGGKHLLNVQPEKKHKGAEEQQTGQDIRNEEIKEEVGEEKSKPEEQRRQDEQVEREDEEKEQQEERGGKQEKVQVQEHEKNDMEKAPRKYGKKEGDRDKGDKENEDEDEKYEDGEEKVEGKSELEYQGRKVVEEDGKDNDEDDDKEVEEEEETDEDDEEQTGEQKQELGEFEVVEYASETKDRYRETVDKLMTPLSFSSPYLPSDGKAIRKHVTIYDCLMYFTRKEHIHNEYLCNPCYAKHLADGGEDVLLTSATKQTMIFNPPAILTLHLKRFELKPGGSVKRTDMITYGELLDIAPYCSSMCLRNDPPCQNIWYTLYGVVVHHGSTLKSGHYMAYVKIKDSDARFKKFLQEKYFDRDLTREQLMEMMQEKQPGDAHKQPGGTWYCMNDSWSHEVPVAEVLNQEAYLLFYERMS